MERQESETRAGAPWVTPTVAPTEEGLVAGTVSEKWQTRGLGRTLREEA